MISTFLLAHPWMAPTALALLGVFGPLVGRLVAHRPRAAWLLTGLATFAVLVLTMYPNDRRAFQFCEVSWLQPTLYASANVVLFVGPALFAAVATRRPALTFLTASVLSALIELVQALVPTLGRSCATDDWLANTTGAALGVLLAVIALRLAGPSRRPDRAREVTRDHG